MEYCVETCTDRTSSLPSSQSRKEELRIVGLDETGGYIRPFEIVTLDGCTDLPRLCRSRVVSSAQPKYATVGSNLTSYAVWQAATKIHNIFECLLELILSIADASFARMRGLLNIYAGHCLVACCMLVVAKVKRVGLKD